MTERNSTDASTAFQTNPCGVEALSSAAQLANGCFRRTLVGLKPPQFAGFQDRLSVSDEPLWG